MRAALHAPWHRLPPWPFLVLLAAAGAYGYAGSPTPDAVGWVEGAVALGLVTAVGLVGARGAVAPMPGTPQPLWVWAARAFLLYGTFGGLAAGLLAGNAFAPMARDLVAFWFMLLPLFLWPRIAAHPRAAAPALLVAVCAVGLLFAARAKGYGPFPPADDLLYLSNAPTVLCAGLLLGGLGTRLVFTRRDAAGFALGVAALAAALVPALAVASNLQRASFGALIAVGAVLVAGHMIRRPRRGAVLLALLAVAGVWLVPWAWRVASDLIEKSQSVGLNRRSDEMIAVWTAISANPGSLLFGLGWGGSFPSPAVGGWQVNFTHSLLTSALLKGGLVGLTLTLAYIGALAVQCAALARRSAGLALAIAAPVAIATLLYASYKSLDFGLVLTLIPAGAVYLRAHQNAKSQG